MVSKSKLQETHAQLGKQCDHKQQVEKETVNPPEKEHILLNSTKGSLSPTPETTETHRATKWMELENIKLKEVSQTPTKINVLPCIWELKLKEKQISKHTHSEHCMRAVRGIAGVWS